MDKVFGIGFHKTATASLERALEMLGYRVYGPAADISSRDEAKKAARQILRDYDALQDFPWPILYKWLDDKYPGSKFILTIRPAEDWISSMKRDFEKRSIKSHKIVYGNNDPVRQKSLYIEKYKKHNKEVIKYFGERRGNDLLVMDITKGDGWGKLCSFLGFSEPWIPFPKRNISKKSMDDMSFMQKVRMKPESWLQLSMKHYRRGQLLKKVYERGSRILSRKIKIVD